MRSLRARTLPLLSGSVGCARIRDVSTLLALTTRPCIQAGATARIDGASTTENWFHGTFCFAWRRTSTRTRGTTSATRRYGTTTSTWRTAASGIFIRFNPDGRGIDMEDKLARLIGEVETQTTRIERSENTALVEVVKLFY
jgi:hypothetical protein